MRRAGSFENLEGYHRPVKLCNHMAENVSGGGLKLEVLVTHIGRKRASYGSGIGVERTSKSLRGIGCVDVSDDIRGVGLFRKFFVISWETRERQHTSGVCMWRRDLLVFSIISETAGGS